MGEGAEGRGWELRANTARKCKPPSVRFVQRNRPCALTSSFFVLARAQVLAQQQGQDLPPCLGHHTQPWCRHGKQRFPARSRCRRILRSSLRRKASRPFLGSVPSVRFQCTPGGVPGCIPRSIGVDRSLHTRPHRIPRGRPGAGRGMSLPRGIHTRHTPRQVLRSASTCTFPSTAPAPQREVAGRSWRTAHGKWQNWFTIW
jgi:hypothetical protein